MRSSTARQRRMNFNAVNAFSIVFAAIIFSLFTFAVFFAASTICYAVYKDKYLQVPTAVPVINLCFAGLLLEFVSGVFTLVFDVLQINSTTELGHGVKSFIEEFAISVYFQALFLISITRYSLVLCGRKLARMTVKQTTCCITFSWIISTVYASLVTFFQQEASADVTKYSRGVAAAQFAFLAFLHFGTLCIYANLVIYFHQKTDNLPPDFYSLDSSRRRIAERNVRVSAKNIQMIALMVLTLCSCHLPYLGCITTAMFTGQLSHDAKVCAVVLMQCGILVNFVIYGYLNKRLKRVIRPLLHRIVDKITHKRRRRQINELLPMNNLSYTGSSLNISRSDSYELTRSKLALFNR